jgi:hypothetical protein
MEVLVMLKSRITSRFLASLDYQSYYLSALHVGSRNLSSMVRDVDRSCSTVSYRESLS